MEMLRTPLYQTVEANRAELKEREKQNKQRIRREGDEEGNRHQRRLAARIARLAVKVSTP